MWGVSRKPRLDCLTLAEAFDRELKIRNITLEKRCQVKCRFYDRECAARMKQLQAQIDEIRREQKKIPTIVKFTQRNNRFYRNGTVQLEVEWPKRSRRKKMTPTSNMQLLCRSPARLIYDPKTGLEKLLPLDPFITRSETPSPVGRRAAEALGSRALTLSVGGLPGADTRRTPARDDFDLAPGDAEAVKTSYSSRPTAHRSSVYFAQTPSSHRLNSAFF